MDDTRSTRLGGPWTGVVRGADQVRGGGGGGGSGDRRRVGVHALGRENRDGRVGAGRGHHQCAAREGKGAAVQRERGRIGSTGVPGGRRAAQPGHLLGDAVARRAEVQLVGDREKCGQVSGELDVQLFLAGTVREVVGVVGRCVDRFGADRFVHGWPPGVAVEPSYIGFSLKLSAIDVGAEGDRPFAKAGRIRPGSARSGSPRPSGPRSRAVSRHGSDRAPAS